MIGKIKWSMFSVLLAAMLLAFLPASGLANSKTLDGVTLYFPDSYTDCAPYDIIVTVGAAGLNVQYWFGYLDRTTGWILIFEEGTAVGELAVPFSYPSVLGGNMEFVVWIQVEGGSRFGGKWTISCTPTTGDAGCTPGYWRNHLEDWPPTGYSPGDIFDTVFRTSYFSPTYDLEDAIWQGGGGINRLARHGAAALLSAAHADVAYPFTVAEVIAMVQAGIIDPLAAANELGCSIP